ncbi:MAG: geranylgeranyl reductase family protein [Desulfosarcina sp.]|nr:geranylgeranyl reductase family protein [Desulfobacterales bacterium]
MGAARFFDVVIVGAGPAGGFLSYLLAAAGLRILLLEKKKLPRYKPCGGGVTPRALKLLPFDLGTIVEDVTTTARMFVKGRKVFARTYPHAVVSMVMRAKLDAFLARRAVAAGAALEEGVRFLSAAGPPGGMTIETSAGQVQTIILVGADGVHSRVARHLDLPVRYRVMTAIETELDVDRRLLDRFRHAFDFDFGVIPHGYGWVFPKKRHLSVGILTRRGQAKAIRDDFDRYLRLKGLGAAHIRSLRLHPIPYAPYRANQYACGRGLIVGDATGMADPITGEGIYYALRTAQLAAATVRNFFIDRARLVDYDAVLRVTVGREVRYAGLLADILYRLPCLSYPVLSRFGDRIGRKHMEVFEGQVSYPELFRYVVGWKGLKHLLVAPEKTAKTFDDGSQSQYNGFAK